MGLPWHIKQKDVSLPRLADLCLGQTVDFRSFVKGHGVAYTGIVTKIEANLMETLMSWSHPGSNGLFWTNVRITFAQKGMGSTGLSTFTITLGDKVQLDEKTHEFRYWFSRSAYDPASEYRLSKTMFHTTYDKGQHTLGEIITTDLFSCRWNIEEKEPAQSCL